MASLYLMHTILVIADRESVIDYVSTALSSLDITVIHHRDPETAADVAYSENLDAAVDAVLVDMQIGSMGALAVTREIQAGADNGVGPPVTILLDREADTFLARRSGAHNWIMNNAPASELRAALTPATATA